MQQAAVVKAIHEAQATFLDNLNAVLGVGAFIEVDQPATDDEPEIGEMTDYERALYTVAKNYHAVGHEIAVKNFDAFQNFTGKPEDEHRVLRQIRTLKEHHGAAMKLLWASIEDRLHEKIHAAADHTSIAIRQGGKVVLIFGEEDCFSAMLGRLVGIHM